MKKIVEVRLPYPDHALNPNGRAHWAAKARATKKHRALAGWTAREAGAKLMTLSPVVRHDIVVQTEFYPKTNRWRDKDNAFASCKAYFDGISDAIGIDDHWFTHKTPVMHEKDGVGTVVITLWERKRDELNIDAQRHEQSEDAGGSGSDSA